jgi:hypothetical protein
MYFFGEKWMEHETDHVMLMLGMHGATQYLHFPIRPHGVVLNEAYAELRRCNVRNDTATTSDSEGPSDCTIANNELVRM